MGFEEAENRFAEIKVQLHVGTLNPEEFEEQLEELKVQDADGTWWAKGRKPGAWYYHDGSTWVRGVPPHRRRTSEVSPSYKPSFSLFQNAEELVRSSKRQLDEGTLSTEEFDRTREVWKVQDAEGTWWALGREPKTWYYHNGSTWVRGVPPHRRQQYIEPGAARALVWTIVIGGLLLGIFWITDSL